MGQFETSQITRGQIRLKELIGEIELKARELQALSDKVSEKKSEYTSVEKNIFDRMSYLTQLESDTLKESDKNKDIRKSVKTLTTSVSVLESQSLSFDEKIKEQKKVLSEGADEIISVEKSIAHLKGKEEKVRSDLSLIGKELLILQEEYRSIVSSVEHSKQEMNSVEEKKQAVEGAITTALENFRVFEGRILQLSEETGYQVGYKKIQNVL